ncbi:MAG: cytochrome c, class [Gemmatimonadetes bacterium]|nr:cytochrome c, class [Gemmatimonadota bacterium]
MMPRVFAASLIVALIPVVSVVPLLAWGAEPRALDVRAERTVWDSVYTAAQASRGETLYVKSCARCHQVSLAGADESPPLTGGAFMGNWSGLPLADLQNRIRTTMPSDSVGIYNRQLVTDVMAYLLKANGFPAGATELPTDTEALRGIMMRASRP